MRECDRKVVEELAHEVSIATFREFRKRVARDASTLIEKSIAQHNSLRYDRQLPLLTQEGWIPARPIELGRVALELDTEFGSDFSSARKEASVYWPEVAGNPYPPYSQVVSLYDQPSRWYNGNSFRLIGVSGPMARTGRDAVRLRFGSGTYFEAYDTCEPLGFEAAVQYSDTGGTTIKGPYREWLRRPFDLHNRCAVPGIDTLTIRQSGKDITFFMHRRTGVATAMGTNHVVPAGEFQPSGQRPEPYDAELDFRSTIVREYAEELLDAEDVISQQGNETQIDFDKRYHALNRAVTEGARVHYLGIGLYPLTWKPEILLVCVFPAQLFDRVFKKMVPEVYEGKLVTSDSSRGLRYILRGRSGPYHGLRFDEETVAEYADSPSTLSAARGCLTLAWRHRDFLGLGA